MRLDPADIEAIARRVADLLGVERDWVYAHAQRLGAIRLGGPQGRLRFDVHHVQRTLTPGDTQAASGAAQRRPGRCRRSAREGLELLPYES